MKTLGRFSSISPTLVLGTLIVICTGTPLLRAQLTIGISDPTARVERNAYRTLFRQNLLYQRLADEAEASHNPKPFLRRLVQDRFQLSDEDYASLCRLSVAYQKEIDPMHQQIIETISKFQARLPSGVVGPEMNAEPPPELTTLQQQEDTVTLRYRDFLRNSMREEAFQKFKTRLLEKFGKEL